MFRVGSRYIVQLASSCQQNEVCALVCILLKFQIYSLEPDYLMLLYVISKILKSIRALIGSQVPNIG